MSRKKLRLLNEVLPTPERASVSTARERTLSRLATMVALAAASTAALEACKTEGGDAHEPDEEKDAARPPNVGESAPASVDAASTSVTVLVDAGSVQGAPDSDAGDAGQKKVVIPKRPKHTQPSYHVVDMLPDPAMRMSPERPK